MPAMTPEQYTAALATTGREAVKAVVQTIAPLLSALLAGINSPDLHRFPERCACGGGSDAFGASHAEGCPMGVILTLPKDQRANLYRLAQHAHVPACHPCCVSAGLMKTSDPINSERTIPALEID